MKSKWLINLEGFEDYRFGDDGELYRLPCTRNGRRYGLKKISKQKSKRWIVNGQKWSEAQLKPHIEVDKFPVILISKEDMPV